MTNQIQRGEQTGYNVPDYHKGNQFGQVVLIMRLPDSQDGGNNV